MYLVPIHVPIFVRGSELLLSTDWRRSLLLLRDSFNGRYGRLRVVAPSIEVDSNQHDQLLEPLQPSDELELFPSFPYYTRAREFWQKNVHIWRRDVGAHIPTADVVHTGFDDVYRPILFTGFLLAHQANKPTVFVQDTDHVLQMTELTRGKPLPARIKAKAYTTAYEQAVRYGVARASLSLLKGQALIDRYGKRAKNPKNFHDTSFFSDELVEEVRLERRLQGLLTDDQPLKLVYCGRLEARKGLHESIDAIAAARARGARVTFDVIGDGAVRQALENQVDRLGLREAVRFLGMRTYGRELLSDLAGYDALFFTPIAEDTPRMIFDGYAAGLPLVGYEIAYVLERAKEDGAAASCERTPLAAAQLLVELDRDRPRLAALSRKARQAAVYHAADAWYRRRADWTNEAVEQHRRESKR
ncbi:MAG TPA: glycosyltransferase [Polyangiales bacterium]|nr:glycosyltransferase [Polyangiales bacterium]